ncbi:hypothetical protein Cgig2_010287 [Carnegiea gigantea]|uniref:Endonuclease/exonuclease/phosphatase domain-containing protein n=1 Tax=Carnegiea gigantea TaxID=171969 RepID=A0A9Q1JGD7_9CARY|nr:hypothetical protein Cgig2_010287 [Carnegiea gigantea]
MAYMAGRKHRYDFLWCNYQANGIVVEERLDRFCADAEWSLMFPEAAVTHINSDMSNHSPILLKCFPHMDTKGAHKKRFRFENTWMIEQTCKDIASVSKPNAVDKLLGCIDKCLAELLKWNKTTFGHVQCRINEMELQLKSQRDAISQRNTLELIRDWHKKEEILWWQRACSDYLKYGDSNTQCNLIDYTAACWRESLVRQIFLDCNSELILKIPLCSSWPPDKLTWHCHS